MPRVLAACAVPVPGSALRRVRALLSASLIAAGAAGAQPAPPVFVVLGSSTAEGVGATNKDSSWVGRYAARLAARPGPWKVINLARGGYTTYHVLPTGSRAITGRPAPDTARNITKALSLKPKGLLVNMPSNDANSGYTAAQQKANYDTLAAVAARAGVPLWVCTPQPRSTLIGDSAKKAALLEVRDWIPVRFGTRSVDFWTGIARADASIDPAYNAGDGIHLNDRGHKLLYERVLAEAIPEALENPVALALPAASARKPNPALPTLFLSAGRAFDARGRNRPLVLAP